MSNKAQIKFGETIGVIIVVYIVIMVGLVWYNNVNMNDLSKLYEEDRKNLAFDKYYFIVNHHLLRQSEIGFIDERFDVVSLKNMEYYSMTTGREYMNSNLGFANISVVILAQDNLIERVDEITLYENYPERSRIQSQETFRTLIPIRDETLGITQVGVLEVRVPILRN